MALFQQKFFSCIYAFFVKFTFGDKSSLINFFDKIIKYCIIIYSKLFLILSSTVLNTFTSSNVIFSHNLFSIESIALEISS